MIGNHLQRLFPLVSTSSARSKTNRTPSTSVAHRPARLPQSQPMQRSVGTPVSDSESSSPGSPPSDDDLIFESATSTYASSQPLLTHLPDTLHNPLHSGDPTLLCILAHKVPLTLRCRRASVKIVHQTQRTTIFHTINTPYLRGLFGRGGHRPCRTSTGAEVCAARRYFCPRRSYYTATTRSLLR